MKIDLDAEVVPCYSCDGTGKESSGYLLTNEPCQECDGYGTVLAGSFLDEEDWDRTISMDDLLDERY